jgi:hypothetical protein
MKPSTHQSQLALVLVVTFLIGIHPARLFAADTPTPTPAPAEAAGKPDLSSPVSATKAFFNAVKAGDYATVEKTLGPEMQERVKKRKVGMEGFAKELMAEGGKVLSISDEALFPKGGEAEGRCKVPVTFHHPDRGTKVVKVDLVKVNGEWRISSF